MLLWLCHQVPFVEPAELIASAPSQGGPSLHLKLFPPDTDKGLILTDRGTLCLLPSLAHSMRLGLGKTVRWLTSLRSELSPTGLSSVQRSSNEPGRSHAGST